MEDLRLKQLQQCAIHDVMPSTSFSLIWKDVLKEQPKEMGRYWCIVREINDLGTSYFQWNCSYDKKENAWFAIFEKVDVIWWTELAPMPF